MRKMNKYILMISALVAVLSSCVREAVPTTVERDSRPFLSILPGIFNGGETKVADTDAGIKKGDLVDARDELRENFFGSLDVFVKRQDAAENGAWFKQYHLNAGDAGVVIDTEKYDSESLLNQAKQILASNWAEQGYEVGVPYDIYVTANNPHTAAASAPASLTALKALQTNSTDIYRYFLNYTPPTTDPVYYSNCMYSEKKNFLMDGKIEGWQVDPSTSEQVFDVDLKRAAAKVIVTVKFSDDKTIPMAPEPTPSNPNPEPQKDAQGRVIYGSIQEYMAFVDRTAGVPRWKAVNFNLNGSDIAYDGDTLPKDGSLLTLDNNFTPFQEGTDPDNTNNTFALVTYTYSVDWSADKGRAPYILLSVFYTRNSDGDQLRSYYRIPVCDESKVTSLDRNNVYIVDVEIASLGSSNESFEAKDEELRIEYHVIPWTETNMSQEATTVKISDTKYLTVLPTEYILKGDDTQSVEMLWYASVSIDDGRIVDIDPSSLNVTYVNYQGNTVDIKGTVTKQVKNDSGTLVTATDANTDGKRNIVITSTAPNTGAQGEKVTITLTPNGLITVDSEALASRAVKDISFTVYLKNATGVDPVTITVRHFPLDNIQSFTGVWSSKWDEVSKTNPSTGSWVDWDTHKSGTNYDNIGFYAKVYTGGFAHLIGTNGTSTATSAGGASFSNLTNRQMYVIQLTSTSDDYAIGKPVLDGNYQSQDNVCSPAFMIASQLGAVSGGAYTAATAAEHCGTYMEVGDDGTRYVGWRLPTKAEIETIIKYQTEGVASYGVTMVRVLAGRYYWALDGNRYQAYASGSNNTFTRCVRDLTMEEVNKLNKTKE